MEQSVRNLIEKASKLEEITDRGTIKSLKHMFAKSPSFGHCTECKENFEKMPTDFAKNNKLTQAAEVIKL
eukprot:6485154-Amphidinium_carterae.1